MMRIITGSARGTRLASLEGDATRPTSERVKEALFSSIQFDIEGRCVLDLFAGSGQLGLEALSRGAASVMFVDSSADAIAIVKENARKTGFFDSSRFLVSDYRNYLRKAAGRDAFHLIFIDPPYAMNLVGDSISRILKAKLAKPGCLFVCESGTPDIFAENPALIGQFTVVKQARYSITYITILAYRGEPEEASV